MYPKISVVTPSFNQGAFLEETILSVLSQNYPNLEFMIIDGASSDGSLEIIKKYEKYLTYWVSEKDSGQSEAINKGLKRATGDIISWLCSDDMYMPNTLFKVAQLFSNNSEAVLIHGKAILFGDSKKERIIGATEKELPLKYFSVIPFPQPSSFFKRKLINEQGLLNPSLHYAMDYDLLVRAALNYSLVSSKEIFSKYRMHKQSKSAAKLEYFVEEWIMVFSKFLRSVERGKIWIEKLNSISLYADGSDVYYHRKKFRAEELKIIVLFFIELIVHFEYGKLNKERVLELLNVVQNIDKDFFKSHHFNKLKFRLNFLPPPLIKLMRKISR